MINGSRGLVLSIKDELEQKAYGHLRISSTLMYVIKHDRQLSL